MLIFDNSFGIAEKSFETEIKILDETKFNNLKKYWNERI